jgi:hypothetical protein
MHRRRHMEMTVQYVCRHCDSSLGMIHQESVTEQQLGFHFLTLEERRDIIAYNQNGHITVKVSCEYCNEAYQANPELVLLASPLQ